MKRSSQGSMVRRLQLSLEKDTSRGKLADDARRVLEQVSFLGTSDKSKQWDAATLVNIICSGDDFFNVYKTWFLSSNSDEDEGCVLDKIKTIKENSSDDGNRQLNRYRADAKQKEVDTLNELSKTKGILTATTQLLEKVQRDNTKLSLENQQLKKKPNPENQGNIRALEVQLQQLNTKYEALKTDNGLMRNQITKLTKQCDEHSQLMDSKDATMKCRKKTMQKQIDEKEKELRKTIEAMTATDMEMKRMQEMVKKLEDNFKAKEIDMSKKEDEMTIERQNNKARLQKLNKKLEESDRDRTARASAEMEKLKVECEQYKNESKETYETITTLKTEIHNMKVLCEKHDQEVALLQQKLETSEKEMKKLEVNGRDRTVRAAAEMEKLKVECEQYQTELTELKETIATLQSEIKDMNVGREDYDNEVGMNHAGTSIQTIRNPGRTTPTTLQNTSEVADMMCYDNNSPHQSPNVDGKSKNRKRKRTGVNNTAPSYPWTCTICGKVYTTRSSKSVHMVRHNKPERYKCPDCDFNEYRKDKLDIHQRSTRHGKPSGGKSSEGSKHITRTKHRTKGLPDPGVHFPTPKSLCGESSPKEHF